MDLDPLAQCFLVSSGLLLVSVFALFRRMRQGNLFTASGGLHTNILLFFGVGGLTYTFSQGWVVRFDPYQEIVQFMATSGIALLSAYILWILLEKHLRRSEQHRSYVQTPMIDNYGLIVLAVFWILSVIGRFGSELDFAKSGLGTIFPVLRMFEYPIVAITFGTARREKPSTFWFTGTVLAISAYQAFISPWRSDVILLTGAVSFGLMLRGSRMLITSQLLLAGCLLFLLPFVNLKKISYDEVIGDPLSTFAQILRIPIHNRIDSVIDFWSVRINGLREAAFVSKALEEGNISYRYGDTYLEALQQLVPRVIWPDKPAFNYTTNFTLPRQIGLLSPRDESTSWGVNFYAEAIWNIGPHGLLFFVPSIFFLVGKLDKLILNVFKNELNRWLVQGAFFFTFIDCVGLVNMGTYLGWAIVVAGVIETILRSVVPLHESTFEDDLGPEST